MAYGCAPHSQRRPGVKGFIDALLPRAYVEPEQASFFEVARSSRFHHRNGSSRPVGIASTVAGLAAIPVAMAGGRNALRSRPAIPWSFRLVSRSSHLASGPSLAQVPQDVEIRVRELPEVPAEPQAVPGEVIVKTRPGVAPQSVLPAATLVPLGLRSAPRMTSGGELIYQLTPQAMFALQSEQEARARVEALAAQLSARPEVEYAQPNWILHPSLTPNDPLFALQWHYRNNGSGSDQSPGGVNLVNAWDTERGDPAVVVAVPDTGILPAEADIAGSPNLAPGFDMITDPFIANDGNGRDSDATDPGDAVAAGECGRNDPPTNQSSSWHGSHVAGTIGVVNTNNGAGVAGTNWFVSMVPVRVLGKCGATNADINDGIRWAAGLPVPGVPIQSAAGAGDQHEPRGSGGVRAGALAAGGDQRCGGCGHGGGGGGRQRGDRRRGHFAGGCDNVIAVAARSARAIWSHAIPTSASASTSWRQAATWGATTTVTSIRMACSAPSRAAMPCSMAPRWRRRTLPASRP